MTTLKQLLTDGANPKLVQCPQSAPLIAVMSNSPDLVRYLVDCGANINENHQVRYFIIQILLLFKACNFYFHVALLLAASLLCEYNIILSYHWLINLYQCFLSILFT